MFFDLRLEASVTVCFGYWEIPKENIAGLKITTPQTRQALCKKVKGHFTIKNAEKILIWTWDYETFLISIPSVFIIRKFRLGADIGVNYFRFFKLTMIIYC